MAYHDDVIINVSQPDKLDPKDGFVSVDIKYDREALFRSFMLDDKDEWWIDAQETKTNTFFFSINFLFFKYWYCVLTN